MDKYNFTRLIEDKRPLILDKDLVIQKTIIFYEEKILLELNKLEILIKSISQIKKVNYFDNSKDQMIQLLNMKIPKVYGGNNEI